MTRISIAGDVILNQNLARLPSSLSSRNGPWPTTVIDERPGGANHLYEIVRAACSDLSDVEVVPKFRATNHSAEAISIWAPHPLEDGSREKVWRIEQTFEVFPIGNRKAHPQEVPGFDGPTLIAQETTSVPSDDLGNHRSDILILDDAALSFRHMPEAWRDELKISEPSPHVVLKTRAPLGTGELWDHLVANQADQLTTIVSVTSLRARGGQISYGLSWDRTIEELCFEITHGMSARDLARARKLVVSFAKAGVVVFTRVADGKMVFDQAIVHPEDLEGAWHSRHPGVTRGTTSILTAASVLNLVDPDAHPIFPVFSRALDASRFSHKHGLGVIQSQNVPALIRVFRSGQNNDQVRVGNMIRNPGGERSPQREYFHALPSSVKPAHLNQASRDVSCDLLRGFAGSEKNYLLAMAIQVVLLGPERALRSIPKARYRDYITIDRDEIEKINEIRRLLLSYKANRDDVRPLSIAVFGAPGSGKSFAIEQLAKTLFGDEQGVLNFNLTQYNDRDDLHVPFDQIRDMSVRGQVPLVFWDEFDTNNSAWLKDFLAPMQDAKFVIRGRPHPFGKVVFIFAGGTSATYRDFNRSDAIDCDEPNREEGEARCKQKEFKERKGPDFVSRLRGYMEIKGPNPITIESGGTENQSTNDDAHLIRRAILLRSILRRLHPHLIHPGTGFAAVHPGVIRAFLLAKEYLHGARSMEQIVGMSPLVSAQYYGVTELPSRHLTMPHVTSEFMEQVRIGVNQEAVVEYLAQEIHNQWRKEKDDSGANPIEDTYGKEDAPPRVLDFSERRQLDEEHRRHAARVCLAMIEQAGYRIEPSLPRHGMLKVSPSLQESAAKKLRTIETQIPLRTELMLRPSAIVNTVLAVLERGNFELVGTQESLHDET